MGIRYNIDILYLILEELQDDSITLFSCLMVNELWCNKITIPILWRNPWRYNINYSNKNNLFNIIYSYLSQEIKITIKLTSHSLSPYQQPLLFDYLSYCKSINIKIINDIISVESSCDNRFILQLEFCNLLIRKCPKLKHLNTISINHQMILFHLPEIKTLLESLCELTCDSSTDPLFFNELAHNCKNIQRFIIINTIVNVNNGIVKLIEAQKNLKYFEWKDDFEENYNVNNPYINDFYDEMLIALEKKSNIINHLILYFQFIHHQEHKLYEILPKFYKLKTLTLNKYYLKTAKIPIYHDLETLDIDYITMNAAVNIINNSGGNLKELLLNFTGYYDDDYRAENYIKDTLNLIRKIYENCPLIETLNLIFPSTNEHFVEFEKLLRCCPNLKKLFLIIDDNCDGTWNYEQGSENIKHLLKLLIRSAPTGLKDIRIFNDYIPYLESLEILEQWSDRCTTIYLGVLNDFYF
jgi:hypothetical protein